MKAQRPQKIAASMAGRGEHRRQQNGIKAQSAPLVDGSAGMGCTGDQPARMPLPQPGGTMDLSLWQMQALGIQQHGEAGIARDQQDQAPPPRYL